jgi:hypothetical protein
MPVGVNVMSFLHTNNQRALYGDDNFSFNLPISMSIHIASRGDILISIYLGMSAQEILE